jgi:hypothetical protein
MPLDLAGTARSLGRIALALAAGIATGAILVAAYIHGSFGPELVFEGLFAVSLFYGAAIAGFCIPLWLLLARLGYDGAPAAAALGFVATAVFVSLTYAAGSHEQVPLMTYSVIPYGLCGAAAAVVTRWVSGRLHKA